MELSRLFLPSFNEWRCLRCDKHADGPRQGHPSNEGWAYTSLPPKTGANTFQEPPWLWFALPELGFPLLTDEFRRPIHPEIEEYMRRHVSNDQDWEQVDDEDCWGIDYTEPTAQIREKIETILHTWGEDQPEIEQAEITILTPQRERFSVPHVARDPKILKDRNLGNEDIFELIKKPPEIGAVRIFEQPKLWEPHSGSDHTGHSHHRSTIRPFKYGWSTMAPSEIYPDERWP